MHFECACQHLQLTVEHEDTQQWAIKADCSRTESNAVGRLNCRMEGSTGSWTFTQNSIPIDNLPAPLDQVLLSISATVQIYMLLGKQCIYMYVWCKWIIFEFSILKSCQNGRKKSFKAAFLTILLAAFCIFPTKMNIKKYTRKQEYQFFIKVVKKSKMVLKHTRILSKKRLRLR